MNTAYESEILALIAEREGVLLAESEACGEPLINQWVQRLTPRQVGLIEAYDRQVERYRKQALSDCMSQLMAAPAEGLH